MRRRCGVIQGDFAETATAFLFPSFARSLRKASFGALAVEDEADQVKMTGYCKLIGVIELNGCYFEAYEEENGDGKRFRLKSSPPLSPEREAGLIRYLIYEGIIEQRWPLLNGKIQEEAGWAFWT